MNDARDFCDAVWRKSRRSANLSSCVEVAVGGSAVGVRDSKDVDGGVLVFPAQRWREFVGSLRQG